MNDKPRVLHVITHLALGGAEKISFDIMSGLSDEFRFAVFASAGIKSDAVARRLLGVCHERNISVYRGSAIPSKRGGVFLSAWRFSQAARQFDPDIIHLHTEIPEATYALAGVLGRQARDASVVRTIHNSIYWMPWRWLGKWSERHINSSCIACVSHGALDAFEGLRKDAGFEARSCRVEVIFNGVPMSKAPTLRAGRACEGVIRVMYAGRFEYQKGVDLIREALAYAPLPPGVRGEIVLYGKGRMSDEVEQLRLHPPAGWTIAVHDPVPSLEPLFPRFDLLIMPSRFEGLPLVAVEALVAGVPVIGTDAPGLREVFPAGYPWIAPAGDAAGFGVALRNAMIDPAQWKRVVAAAAPFVRDRFSMERMLSAYRALYRSALNSNASYQSLKASTTY